MSTSIFINYRRADSIGTAGRIYDRLAQKLGKQRIFMDTGAIEPGAGFPERIESSLVQSRSHADSYG